MSEVQTPQELFQKMERIYTEMANLLKGERGLKSSEQCAIDFSFDAVAHLARENQILREKVEMLEAIIEHRSPKFKLKYGYVYIILRKDVGLTKIGLSKQPEVRVKQVSEDVGYPVKILKVYPVSNMAMAESELHKHFRGKRVKNEWFDLDYMDSAKIPAIIKNYIVNTPCEIDTEDY